MHLVAEAGPLQAGVGLFGDPKAGLSGVRLRHARSGGWRLLSAKFPVSSAIAHAFFPQFFLVKACLPQLPAPFSSIGIIPILTLSNPWLPSRGVRWT